MFIPKLIHCCIKKKKFTLNNYGNHHRDFTFIDDVVLILERLIKLKNRPNFEVFNICSNNPIKLTEVIKIIQKKIKMIKIHKTNLQAADVIKTHGSNKKLVKTTKFKNFTLFEDGIDMVIDWSKNYYRN